MDESVIRSCVLFLSLTAPDAAQIFPALEYILDGARRKKVKNPDQSMMALMVKESSPFLNTAKWSRIPSRPDRKIDNTSLQSLITDIKSARVQMKPDEFESFVWLECVGISPEELSEGLGLSEGTLKYRAHRGLKNWADLE